MTTKFLSLFTSTMVLCFSIGAFAQHHPGRGGRGGGFRPPQPPPQHGRYDSTCVVHGTRSNGSGYPSTSTEYEAVGRNDREACNIALDYCYQDRARNCRITSVNGYAPSYPGYPDEDDYGVYPPNQPGHGGSVGGGGYPPYQPDNPFGVGAGIDQCDIDTCD
jgi:hypothetical protein